MGGPYPPPGPPPHSYRRRRGSVVWPVILIVLGLLFLLQNFGLVGPEVWSYLGQLWPVILVLVGLELLLGGRRGLFGLVVGVCLAFALVAILGLTVLTHLNVRGNPLPVRTLTLTQSLRGATSANVAVHFGAGSLNVGSLPGQSDQLAQMTYEGPDRLAPGASYQVRGGQGQLTYSPSGGPRFFAPSFGGQGARAGQMSLLLSPNVPLSLDVQEGAAESRIDLSQLRVGNLALQTGASRTTLVLPRNAGATNATIRGGAATIDVEVPPDVAAQIHYNGGLSALNVDESLFPSTGQQTFRSPDYDSAQNKVDLTIAAGVSTIRVSGGP